MKKGMEVGEKFKFQSLIGRLRTDRIEKEEKDERLVSIPHR